MPIVWAYAKRMAGGQRPREPWWAVALAHFDGNVARTAQAFLDSMFPSGTLPLPTLDGEETQEIANAPRMPSARLDAQISMEELLGAMRRSRNSAPGPDGISNKMLKALPTEALQSLLRIRNRIYSKGIVPS